MFKLVKFHAKRIIRTPFWGITFLILAVCLLVFSLFCGQAYHPINYIVQFDSFYTYIELFLIPLVFCEATWAALQTSSIERICLYSNAQISLGKALGILCSSSLYLLLPIIFVIVSAFFTQTGFAYSMEALIYLAARWAGLISVSQCTAILCVYLFKRPAVFILCLPATVIFSYLNQYLFSWFVLPDSKIPSLFSMQRSNMHGVAIDYAGARLDAFLISKIGYIAVGILAILSLIWLITAARKRIPAIVLAVLILAEGFCIQNWVDLYPKSYTYNEKMADAFEGDPAVSILSYSGEIKLSERVSVNCDVVLSSAPQQPLRFRLDECFEIEQITNGSADLPYERSGDFVTVDAAGSGGDTALLTMTYSGRVYYESDADVINIFSTRRSAALPAPFAFLPTIDGDVSVKRYDLSVNAFNTLISNLDVEKVDQNSYSVQGESITCSLFSGYFTEYEQDGIIFYRALYNQSTDYDTVYEWSKELRYYDLFAQSLTEGQHKTPSKVFMIYALYGAAGFPIVIDDYVLLNYGYPV